MIEPIFELFQPAEHLRVFTPLGIRFWDPALDRQIVDGLAVTAFPQEMPERRVPAFRTPAGIYAFAHLPGMRAVEYPQNGVESLDSPLLAQPFAVEVHDRLRRFVPVVFFVDLPYLGIFPVSELTSPSGENLPGFFLFSAPTRPTSPVLATVRVELRALVDGTPQPAAHAVIEIRPEGAARWYGIADEQGCAAIMFPYPTFGGGSDASSPLLTSPIGAASGQWPLTLRVRYEPQSLEAVTGSSLPDLRSILGQQPAIIWPDRASVPADELSEELVFGQELVVRSVGESYLLISPATSPL